MKQELYFRMSALIKDDDRVVRLIARRRQAGFGIYISLLLELRKRDEYVCAFSTLDYFAEQWHEEPALLREIVCDYELFACSQADESKRCFYSPDLNRAMSALGEWRMEHGRPCRATTVPKPGDTVRKPLKPAPDPAHGHRTATVKRAADGRFTVKEEKASLKELKEIKELKETTSTTSDTAATATVAAAADAAAVVAEPLSPLKRWTELLDEAFAGRQWVEIQAMQSGCGMAFVEQLEGVKRLFHDHVVGQGAEGSILSLRDARGYFSNFNRQGTPTHHRLVTFLARVAQEQTKDDPYGFEQKDPLTGERTYCGIPIPDGAPPRPSEEAVWNVEKNRWEGF